VIAASKVSVLWKTKVWLGSFIGIKAPLAFTPLDVPTLEHTVCMAQSYTARNTSSYL
jgi:hypothetical protein